MNKIVFAQLNIDSIKNKFDQVSDMVKGHIDILMISECKLDNSFPDEQFLMECYGALFRLDRNKLGGGIMLFVASCSLSAVIFLLDYFQLILALKVSLSS